MSGYAMQAGGSLMSGAGQQGAMGYQAGVAMQGGMFQQQIALRNAQLAREQAGAAEGRLRRANRRAMGRLITTQGGRGLELTGSPMHVLADQAMEAEENALLIRYGGEIEAQKALLGGQAAMWQAQTSADLYRHKGKLAMFEGIMGAGTSLLSGAQSHMAWLNQGN